MRAYTVAAAAVSLGISSKALDNVLVRFNVDGVSRVRQGISRRLAARAVMTLDIAFRLSRSGMPLGRALDLATNAIKGGEPVIELEKGIDLVLDLALLESNLNQRLADVVEMAPVPRRGRPPARR